MDFSIQNNRNAYLHELLAHYNNNVSSSVIGIFAGCLALGYFFWGHFPNAHVVSVFSYLILLALARIVTLLLYQRSMLLNDIGYYRIIITNIILTACGWALISFLFLDFNDMLFVLFTFIILAALASGSMTTIRWKLVTAVSTTRWR